MFVVLSPAGGVMIPKSHNFHSLGQQAENPIFTDRDAASRFAEHLARKFPGTVYSLFESVGTVTTTTPPVKWELPEVAP